MTSYQLVQLDNVDSKKAVSFLWHLQQSLRKPPFDLIFLEKRLSDEELEEAYQLISNLMHIRLRDCVFGRNALYIDYVPIEQAENLQRKRLLSLYDTGKGLKTDLQIAILALYYEEIYIQTFLNGSESFSATLGKLLEHFFSHPHQYFWLSPSNNLRHQQNAYCEVLKRVLNPYINFQKGDEGNG